MQKKAKFTYDTAAGVDFAFRVAQSPSPPVGGRTKGIPPRIESKKEHKNQGGKDVKSKADINSIAAFFGAGGAASKSKSAMAKSPAPISLGSSSEDGSTGRPKSAKKRKHSPATPPKSSAKVRKQHRSPAPKSAASAKARKGASPKPRKSAKSPPPAVTDEKPFNGKTLVFTGNLERLERDLAVTKAKLAGAKVTTAVSGRTTYLVVGSVLEDGRPIEEGSKFKKTQELRAAGKPGPSLLQESEFIEKLQKAGLMKAGNVAVEQVKVTVDAIKPTSSRKDGSSGGDVKGILWTEKYKPRTLKDLVGNNAPITKLRTWLQDWEKVHVHGQKKPVTFRGRGVPENVNAKAVLVSGPPGIGKTTACRLVARELGYMPMEFNASDQRNKATVDNLASGLATNAVIGQNYSLKQKPCLVMDEVDGMSGGDRGGGAALIQLIKKSKMPVMCICNDRMSTKVRSLANSCYDIRFTKPTGAQCSQRVAAIAKSEGVHVDTDAMAMLAEQLGGDMRQIINNLEMLSLAAESGKAATVSVGTRGGGKDVQNMLSPFDVCKTLLTSTMARRLSFKERSDMYYVDYDLIPLLMQQNYIKCVENVVGPASTRALAGIAKAADLMSEADMISTAVRSGQEWTLLPSHCVLSTVGPSFYCNNFIGFPEFPQWLGANSTTTKNARLVRELRGMLSQTTSMSARDLRTSGYMDLLYDSILQPLKNGKEDTHASVASCIQLLDQLGVSKDGVLECLTDLRLPTQPDEYKTIDAKTKSALTRSYNKGAHKSKVLLPGSAPNMFKVKGAGTAKGSKGRKSAAVAGSQDDEQVTVDEEDKEAEDPRMAGIV
ncbi:replication factor C subunit, putative [Perkinsus marinus ATCC 50983]|uniref:Replication factor C subunit 1 n=1 Tax=Perkinsus marinus (strain ATCC 50983 / TXsc) TaxID=423536 RepID=C5KTY4_PERM5|nr:replication factor C subunit, putative [Perkinsus marinus ATCC 50983]EER12026.1 replication factor C subunit, putative [Perkinsus marinus ATCC 50983]|eukprot:XP_002780231.1 replication factor C subunit, putative [Perkinsus marinus ATCC 50983]